MACLTIVLFSLQYKTERDGVIETRVERKITVTSDENDDTDHDAVGTCTYNMLHCRSMHSVLLLCPATKSGGVLCYTLRTFECLSVRPSVRPSVRQRLNIRVRSITLIPIEIISRNLVQM